MSKQDSDPAAWQPLSAFDSRMFPNPEAALQRRREQEAQRQRASEAHARELALPNPYGQRPFSELAQALKALQREQPILFRFEEPAGRVLAGAVKQGFLREHPTFAATVEPALQRSYRSFYFSACVFLVEHAADFGGLPDGVAVSAPGGIDIAGTAMIIRLLETPQCNVGAVAISENDRERWRGERESVRRLAGGMAPDIVGESDAILTAWHEIYVAAKSKERVLITGETGTGKLLAAQMIHYGSSRRGGPFERLDCGTLSDTLAESELFGHMAGGFTGASHDKKGRFELSDRGTLCLEEVENLSAGCQAKLLAVLDEHKFRPVGGQEDVAVDVRVIAVTNAPLEKQVKVGTFRQDLFRRLDVLRVTMPPLRHRQGDIGLLASKFGQGFLKEQDISDLEARHYPENVGGLRNEIKRIVEERRLGSGAISESTVTGRPKIELTKEQIDAALADARTVRDAALKLGVSEDTLQRRMKEKGIPSPT